LGVRRGPALLALACAVLAFRQPSSSAAQERAPDLWIDAVAVDARGAPVVDLMPAEIEVWIAGLRIPLLEVIVAGPEGHGRTVVLLLDDAAVSPVLAARVREAAHAFVELMGERDRLGVVSLHGTRLILTSERAALRQAIDAYRPRGMPFSLEDAGRHVLTTMTALARGLLEQGEGPKTIVAIGAGWLLDTPIPPPGGVDLRDAWVAAMQATARAHATLYVVDPEGLGMTAGRADGTGGLAHETGGHAYLQTNDLRGAARRIWQEAGYRYRLGVANPPMQRTAALRALEVRVLRRGVTVRARRAIPGG